LKNTLKTLIICEGTGRIFPATLKVCEHLGLIRKFANSLVSLANFSNKALVPSAVP
jgi:hypothetical protein